MAMAGRCLPRLWLLASASASASSRNFRTLPAFSAASSAALHTLAHDAPRTGTTSFAESDPLARYRSDSSTTPTCLKASSFSILDGPPSNAIHRAPGNNNEPLGLQILAGLDKSRIIRSFSTKASSTSPPPPSDNNNNNNNNTAVIEKPKTLEDFQHEEIVGPTVERDVSPVADELREALEILQKRILSFQKSLIVLGSVQAAGAVWCYVSWHALDPTWQLVPSALLSFLLAFVLRQALQPIAFFGKLEERSRLRIITLSLMITKGFASFFNRARILVAASALALLCVLLYNPSTYLLGLLGILK